MNAKLQGKTNDMMREFEGPAGKQAPLRATRRPHGHAGREIFMQAISILILLGIAIFLLWFGAEEIQAFAQEEAKPLRDSRPSVRSGDLRN